jgi:hypothetical protein
MTPVFVFARDAAQHPAPQGFLLRAAGLPRDVFHLTLTEARAEGQWICDAEPHAPAPVILDQDGRHVETLEPFDQASIADLPAVLEV